MNTTTLTGDLAIALDSTSGTITGTAPDGCVTNYSVSGNVASATPGQTCNTTTDAGVAEVITTSSRTLTLSADGSSLAVMGAETIDKGRQRRHVLGDEHRHLHEDVGVAPAGSQSLRKSARRIFRTAS
jgi:hypothetical protein